ncbi:MAG: ferredoxin [Patescibacteria group bacterium]|nr:ferredoxin [Patescibacteria group bacterium]
MKKIFIDDDLCIGCGACEGTAPDHFELGSDGKAHVKKQYSEEDKDIIKEAKDGCPAGAIEIKEA